VTRTLQRMEQCGLAVRTPHDHDGRGVTVHITAAGRRGHDIVLGRRRDIVEQLLARFDDDDRLRLVELVERFIAGTADYVAHAAPNASAQGTPAVAAG
jgi:DNA-binding MarR family transcriptional regulator